MNELSDLDDDDEADNDDDDESMLAARMVVHRQRDLELSESTVVRDARRAPCVSLAVTACGRRTTAIARPRRRPPGTSTTSTSAR